MEDDGCNYGAGVGQENLGGWERRLRVLSESQVGQKVGGKVHSPVVLWLHSANKRERREIYTYP